MCRMVSVVHITSFLHNRKDQLFESKLSKKLTSPALGSSNTASTDYAIEFNLQIKLTVGHLPTYLSWNIGNIGIQVFKDASCCFESYL